MIATAVEMGEVPGRAIIRIPEPHEVAGHLGEIGHRGDQTQLAFRLGATAATGLSHPQLDQEGLSVLRRHPELAIRGRGWAVLQRPGLLPQTFLGKQANITPDAQLGRRPSRPPRSGTPPFCRCGRCRWPWAPCGASSVRLDRYRCPGRWRSLPGEVPALGPPWHPGHYPTSPSRGSPVGCRRHHTQHHPWLQPPAHLR